MFELRYLPNVVTLKLDSEKCIGCGMCIEVCPHAVFALDDKKARIVDRDACMECGACAKNCIADAISVKPGVGCAAAVIQGVVGGGEPTCGCSTEAATSGQDVQ